MQSAKPTLAVVGHVQHVTLGPVSRLPERGEIVHMDEHVVIPGGGGGVTFLQLCKSPAAVVLFSAVGDDATGAELGALLRAVGAEVHLATRHEPHKRDVVMLTPGGERTILVLGAPLHPRADDPLPYARLADCDGVYFTSYDPELIALCRRARLLVVSARRRDSLVRSGVRADVVVGSALDPREASTRSDYPVPPDVLVMTEGARGGRIETTSGVTRFAAPPPPPLVRSSYGCGDSFAGALLYYLVRGLSPLEACERAGRHGAAVLASADTPSAQLPLP